MTVRGGKRRLFFKFHDPTTINRQGPNLGYQYRSEIFYNTDEEKNIGLAHALEKSGVQVVYGFVTLKTHAKASLVVRKEGKKMRTYVHIGTGNYHPKTAQLYEDLGLFTCDETIASDVSSLFNFLTGYAPEQQYRKLVVAPKYMRKTWDSLIDNEIAEAKEGRPARIIAKMNTSFYGKSQIEKLFWKSQFHHITFANSITRPRRSPTEH